MKTTIQQIDQQLVALLEGELDTAAAVEAQKQLKPLFDNTTLDTVLDCTALQYISASGLRLFLSILKNGKAHGFKVQLKGLNPDLVKVFKMTGFYSLFEIL